MPVALAAELAGGRGGVGAAPDAARERESAASADDESVALGLREDGAKGLV